ncbi:hypothetical protein ABB37_02320 [Leptomonas pyrrhocoris]|uniref:Dual specificity protein phosphatase n=1 Tax=Leptomonas pyrrhocoris TaxID=157538 RepID=A0A0M9G7Z6_LEPPY|nr:hypothetical protein ABB37_02320 [Leptomonas pyrrhocoris]XP_015662739.1 hypothetical protein ABB37_02320 [Leptomonas pyrrhocoris]KPA84299.1 hypothetical protein ABB37_02320 [Leptomonas pyrrhocoris]KPA84300.1 hypothetical protein ABB37_02320 [Leptomonas pyrrhocoris]|eukprot:XP_015662738.1 hypothetical protein ABB37_02320 [Leptomonas pyrrhocoris]
MGNRVSTSTSPFSLEDLEAIARTPPVSSATAVSATCPSLPFDAVAADLAAAVSTPNSSSGNGTGAARKGGAGAAANAVDTGSSLGSSGSVHLRKENIKAEIEQQFAEVETSLHALRCVPDFSRGYQLSLLRRESRHSDPLGRTSDADLDNDEGNSSSSSGNNNRNDVKSGVRSGRATKRRASSSRAGITKSSAASLPAVPSTAKQNSAVSPRSWIFRDVSVQPLDLTQAVDVNPAEVYVVVLVQRSMAVSGPSPSPPSTTNTAANLTPPPQSLSGAAAAALAENPRSSSAGPRTTSTARPTATTTGNANSGGSNNTNDNSGRNTAEWPRDMVCSFTPRGLSTPFSSDFNRPTSGAFSPSGGGGVLSGSSPFATPRTSGSMSNRPTPRNGGTATSGSPHSASSLPTPRASGFHYSIHLLTGRQADALTAAAGFLTARALEKLFLECPDFDRRLFYHVHTPKAEETIRAYNLFFAAPDKAGGVAARGRDTWKAANSGEGGGFSSAPGPAATSNNHSSSSFSAAAFKKGIQRGPGSGTSAGRAVASVAPSTAGVSPSPSSSNWMSLASGVSRGSSLYEITATQEASKELLRELLAAMRPVPVVAPRFERHSEPAASAGGAATSPVVSPITAAAAAITSSSPPAAVASSSTHSTVDIVTIVPLNTAEMCGANALFRVLSGYRGSTPRWSHAGEMTSPLNSARFVLPGGASGAGTTQNLPVGMSSWHHEPLPPFRPPRRDPSLSGGDPGIPGTTTPFTAAAGGTHAGDLKMPPNTSSWLQGPQPLDVHSATPAATSATTASAASTTPPSVAVLPPPPLSSPSSSATPRGASRLPISHPCSAGSEPRLKLTGGHPYSSSVTTTSPQLPSLALDTLLPSRYRPTPLNEPPTVTQTVTPSLVTTPQQLTTQPRFALRFDALLPNTSNFSPQQSPAPLPSTDVTTTAKLKASQRAALPMAGRTSHNVSADACDSSSVEQGAPGKHPRPHSHHPSIKRGDTKRGDTPAKKHRPQTHAATPQDEMDEADAACVVGDVDDDDYNEVSAQQERAQRLKAAQPEVTEVLPFLFVGGETAARDRAQLLRKGITHIVNTVSWCLDNFHPDAFRYFTLSLSDAADEPVFSLFAVVNAFVEKARGTSHNTGRVFIHCQQGVSRSCTFVIAYVMWKLGLCYDRAYELVRARRNVCSPNTGFLMNLRMWEAHLTTPQLNKIYSFAPYTAESLTPFVYQLASYYTCSTVSTQDTAEVSQEAKEAYYQLCADVLRRAVDHRSSVSVDNIALDPRMCHAFLCAPRRTCLMGPTAEGAGNTAGAPDEAGKVDNDEECQVEACFLVGATSAQKEHVERAFAAFHDLLHCGFYHGHAHTSTDNAGRVVRFTPLRRVRLIPPAAATSSASSYTPAAAASVDEAQALFARHVAGRCCITYAPQPQWEALLSLPGLSDKLTQYIAEDASADAGEAARRSVRAVELATLAHGNDQRAASRSAEHVNGAAPSNTALSASAPPPSLRPSRHTPRALRQPKTAVGSRGVVQRPSEAERPSSSLAPQPPSAVSPPHRTAWPTDSPSLDSQSNSSHPSTSNARTGTSGFALSALPTAAMTPDETRRRTPRESDRTSDPPSADGAAGDSTRHSAAAASASASTSQPPLLDDSSVETNPLSRRAPAKAISTSQSPAQVSHVTLPGGDSFAYTYPFKAASKAMLADLDDLEADTCYVVGFQQRSGISVYLWRGAESPLEVQQVVDAFVDQMLESPRDAAQLASLKQSLERKSWTACTLFLPCSDACDDADSGEHGVVLSNVRVLFVEQGEEPEEFLTLL